MDAKRLLILASGESKSSRTITLSTGSSASSLVDLQIPQYGGSFSYTKDDIQLCSHLSRRFVVWRVNNDCLDVEENSFDSDLAQNSLRVQFKNDVVLHGVAMGSAGGRIYLLVPTFSVAQRICVPYFGGGMPHQEAGGSRASFDRSRLLGSLSVLALVDANQLSSPRNCYTLNIGTGSATPRTAAAALSSSEEALFAYALTDGTIVLVTMAAYDDDGPTLQDTFSQTSVVRRILTGFITPFSRGETLAPTASTSLTFQVLPEDVLLCASGFDHKLRAWSCRQKELLCETLVQSPYSATPPTVHSTEGDKWRVKASTDHESPFLAVYAVIEGIGQFHIFFSTKQGRRWEMVKVLEFEAAEADLLDFNLSNHVLYTLWTQNGSTVFQWKELNLTSMGQLTHSRWNSEALHSEYANLEENDFDNSERIIDAVFNSRIFSIDVINKAIKLCAKNFSRSSMADLGRLKISFEEYVAGLEEEDALRGGASAKAKFLRSFWSCCLQYDKDCNKPISLLHCPGLALYGVVLLKKVAFLADVTSTIAEILEKEGSMPSPLQSSVVACFTKTRQVYSAMPQLEREFDASVFSYDRTPRSMLCDQMVEAFYAQESTSAKRSLTSAETGLETAFKSILQYLDRSEKIITRSVSVDDIEEDSPMPFDLRTAFRSTLGATYLSAAVDKAIRERYELAKSALLLIALCAHLKWKLNIPAASIRFLEGHCGPRSNDLLRFYATLRWAFARSLGPGPSTKSSPAKHNYILDQLLDHPAGDKIRAYWNTFWNKYRNTDDTDGSEANFVVQATIDAFWPSNMFTVLFDYLIQTEHYESLLELCDRMDSQCDHLTFCRVFVQGCGLLYLDYPKEALEKFRLALEGVERADPLLMQNLSLATENEPKAHSKLIYLLKVAKMYEKKALSEHVIEVCGDIIRITPADDAALVPVFTMMFKHYLRLLKYDDAFCTIMKMTFDRNTQRSCLRQFVFVLQEEKLLGKLNGYDFRDMEEEVLAIVESRARSADLLVENYYDFLYSFFVSRSNYRQAASFTYEMATRFQKEVPGLEALRRQVNALAVSMHTLSLEKEGTWIEVPPLMIEGQVFETSASPKRSVDGEEKQNGATNSRRVGIKEMETEYILAKGNLALAETKGYYTTLIPAKELAKALVQCNLFDMAVSVATVHDFSLIDIIDCLALRCVQSDKPRVTTGIANEDWVRLSENKSIRSITSTSRASSSAWLLLQGYLAQLSHVASPSPLYAAATRRFLSLSQPLPPWFVNEFKKIDFPELLRLLIEYDRLTEALHLLCDYIDAVLGIGPQEFNLRETLTVGKRSPVWLPFSSIDMLLAIFAEKQDEPQFVKLRNQLEEKLKCYFDQLDVQMKLVRRK